jgi:hypothetical protein
VAHDFSQQFLFNKTYKHVKFTDFEGDVQVLKELQYVPAFIIPLELVAELLGHLLLVQWEVLV